MSLIEQAAKRLEQLRKAGVEIPAPIAGMSSQPAEHGAASASRLRGRPGATAGRSCLRPPSSASVRIPRSLAGSSLIWRPLRPRV
jgi:hypothetical protein